MKLKNVIDQLVHAKRRWNSMNQVASFSAPLKARVASERALNDAMSKYSKQGVSRALDLGSGPNPRNPFSATECFGADIRSTDEKHVVYADFTLGKLPFDNSSFDFVTAYDVLEHIPRLLLQDSQTRFPLILLFNEIFRILKRDGHFFCIQPCFPAKEVFQDPTHVNIMTEDTIPMYFCDGAWARIYGYEGSFTLVREGWLGYKYFALLKKSAEHPVRDLNFVQQ